MDVCTSLLPKVIAGFLNEEAQRKPKIGDYTTATLMQTVINRVLAEVAKRVFSIRIKTGSILWGENAT